MVTTPQDKKKETVDDTKRDFLLYSTYTVGAVGALAAAWPFIDSMNPSKDVLALASTELDLSSVEVGQSITAMWRGKPVFIRKRTADEIKLAKSIKLSELKDPQSDFNGWFCPCHGSHYDTSGRIRKGPAPKNLDVPPYRFTNETNIIIG